MVKGESAMSSMRTAPKPILLYAIMVAVLATLVVSIFSLVSVYQIKKIVVPKVVNTNDFIKKLTSHPEMKNYVGISPISITQVNSNNYASLQSQINGLDASYIGNFLVQFSDKIIVYDYDKDSIKGTLNIQTPQLPADFTSKLYKHSETSGLQNQQPTGGQLDASSLNTLKQQFPDVYKNAKVGDYLLRYSNKLVIYDYSADKIVNAVSLP